MYLFAFCLSVVVVLVIISQCRAEFGPEKICTRCETVGKGKSVTPGSFIIEVLLWCCFILPGLIYSAYRISATKRVCLACGSAELIPLDSPAGRTLAAAAHLAGVAPRAPQGA
jgi:hypothetical protein